MLRYDLLGITQIADLLKNASNHLSVVSKRMIAVKQVSEHGRRISEKLEAIDERLRVLSKNLENAVYHLQETDRVVESVVDSIRGNATSLSEEADFSQANSIVYKAGIAFHNKSIEEVGGESVIRYKVKSYFSEMRIGC